MQELERLSLREPLTGLGNRRRFNQVVNQRQDRGFGLLLMDLDHFKRVNDRFGHAVGDEVLSQVADVLRGLAPEPDDLFRLGGEEFAMIVAPDDDEGLETLSRRIVRAVAALRPRDDLGVTLSIGVGRSRPAEPPLELMQRVDRALYQAKADGRNQVAVARD
nr:GGDEF domain-containing protein [Wenzhouxiangella sp. XN79A]